MSCFKSFSVDQYRNKGKNGGINMKKWLSFISFTSIVFVLCACQIDKDEREPELNTTEESKESIEVNQEAKEELELEINIIDQAGVDIGTAKLKEEADGVHITLEAHQLEPGLHGFHIHEKGLCETPNFESAGGHFNPDGKNHGFDDPNGPHAGDMENIEVKEDGTVHIEVMNDRVTLKKGVPHSLLDDGGTALMIHAEKDDYTSQPAGDAGDRIACGVISESKSDKEA